MQAVLLAAVKQQKRVLQRLNKDSVPPPGHYTTNRSVKTLLNAWAKTTCPTPAVPDIHPVVH